jgi:hypothetical protein
MGQLTGMKYSSMNAHQNPSRKPLDRYSSVFDFLWLSEDFRHIGPV